MYFYRRFVPFHQLCFFLIGMVALVWGCGRLTHGSYSIGRDPSWYPTDLSGKTDPINGFVNALIKEIAQVEKISLELIDVNWISLYQGLGVEYDAVLTGLSPNVENRELYDFSDTFLPLGPVLVVRADSSAHSLEDLKEKIVGVSQFDNSVLIVQRYPSIVIRNYENMPTALQDLAEQKIDGVLLASLQAQALVPQLYKGILRIATPPLNEAGLRLAAPQGKESRLITLFNKGLKKLIKKGTYQELLKKYKVN